MNTLRPGPLRALAFASALVGALPLSGCYVLKQGAGQAQLLMHREPLAQVLADGSLSPETRAKLQLITEAKAYAEEVIGLKRTRNYEAFVPLDRDAVTYVVSAAPKDQLKAYTWWFPIIGAVPYKGFFDRADAVAEQHAMDERGFDTILRGVPAFSTLGWLADPVYSPFLAYDPPTLANVIIHETTHATLYLAGQASFNEGFATFVGNEGALGFLSRKFGPSSPETMAARQAIADNAVFTEFVQEASAQLDALYAGPGTRAEKLAGREAVFAGARQAFTTRYLPRMAGHQFRHFPGAAFNNASLISYRTYYNKLDRFVAAHRKLGGDLKATVAFFKDTVAREADPEGFVDRFTAKSPD